MGKKERLNLPFDKRQNRENTANKLQAKAETSYGDNFCNVCMELFENLGSTEAWVKCEHFSFWAHMSCTPGAAIYICKNCNDNWTMTEP